MEAIYRKSIGIDDNTKLVSLGSKWSVRKGQDTDVETYEAFDAQDSLIARYEIIEATSTFPPFGKTNTYIAYEPDGKEIKRGKL